MAINLTDSLNAATTKGKLGDAKQVFLNGDTKNLQQAHEETNAHLGTLDNRSTQMENAIKDISVTGGASTASAVSYDNSTSELEAVNAQGALDELKANIIQETERAMAAEEAETARAQAAEKANATAIIGTDRIADKAVTSEKLADGAVITEKIADLAVTYDKLQSEMKEVVENIKYIKHPKFVICFTDNNDKILWAITKEGNIYYGAGVPKQIVSLINKVYDTFGKYIKHPKFVDIKTDCNGKIIQGTKRDGTIYINRIENKQISSIGENLSEVKEILHGLEKDIDEFHSFTSTYPNVTQLINGFEIPYRNYGVMKVLRVKKDGTGDYTTIQEAINSITDASVLNQYDIQVYDDYVIKDLKELYKVGSRKKNTLDYPDIPVALMITKDWIHVRGVGARKILSIESPDIDMPASCFQNIQTIYPMGNSSIENFEVTIKGGRYAIHQESSGSKTHLDYHATTVYKDLKLIHYGNKMYTNGSGWISAKPQGTGTTSGLRVVYINVEWLSYEFPNPISGHGNTLFDLPNEHIFINCSARLFDKDQTHIEGSLGDRYTCQKHRIIMINCDMKSLTCRLMTWGSITDNVGVVPQVSGTKDYIINEVIGYGNKPMRINYETINTLVIKSANIGDEIEVIGGDAADLIFGSTIEKKSANDIQGYVVGSRIIIEGKYSHIHDLPYLLGNCANDNKHLILKVGSSEVDVVFNKNYMTADNSEYSYNTTPNISTSEILAELNETYSTYCSFENISENIDTFDDCKEFGYNAQESTIPINSFLVRDYSCFNSWRMASENEKAEGFSLETITPNSHGKVALLKKITLSNKLFPLRPTLRAGTLYKIGTDGSLVETSESKNAFLVALGHYTLGYYK